MHPVPLFCGIVSTLFIMGTVFTSGCGNTSRPGEETVTYQDQEGRAVTVPRHIERLSGEGEIVYALGQQHKLVDRGLYGLLAETMATLEPGFAARPAILEVGKLNVESLASLKPQIVFANAVFHKDTKERMEDAGLKVFAVKGENIAESFETVRLMGRVLGCADKADAYLADLQRLLNLVEERTKDIPSERRLKVMFAGPRSVYTVATGEMLQSEILKRAGGENVAQTLEGFWAYVSPEQVAAWNPDVILLGSSKGTYGVEMVYRSAQFTTVKAVKNHRVYAFPSNIGWWDWPAPNCVLGVVWAAKTLYPERFRDVDMLKVADDYYTKYRGHSFTALGGQLP
jgi:iron complex transport system substrate-binding protein